MSKIEQRPQTNAEDDADYRAKHWADKCKCQTCYDTGIIPDSYPDQPCPDCTTLFGSQKG